MQATRLLLVASVASLLLPIAALAKPATCTIQQNGAIQFSGRCDFQPFGGNGSFSIVNSTGGVLLPGIAQVSVALQEGLAEVRGLTVAGIHSRWGTARRNAKNPACWDGADFQICAD